MITLPLTEAELYLLESLVADNEDLFSSDIVDNKTILEEDYRTVFNSIQSKLNKLISLK